MMVRRQFARVLTVLASSTALIVANATVASAHYVYEAGFVYESSGLDQCVYVYAESSHGYTGHGYMKGYVQAWRSAVVDGIENNCEDNQAKGVPQGHWSRPPQNLRVQDYYFRYKGGTTAFPKGWALCELTGDWVYNQRKSFGLTVAGEMKGDQACGAGYYGTLAWGQVFNGSWIGGKIFSGGHKLPQAAKADVVNPDTGTYYGPLDGMLADAAANDGEIGADGAINPLLGPVTIAGPDGNDLVDPLTGQPYTVNLDVLADQESVDATAFASKTADDDVTSALANLTTESTDVPALEGLDEEFYVVVPLVASTLVLHQATKNDIHFVLP